MPSSSRIKIDLCAAGIALLAVAASLWVVTPTIQLDDPFIALRYVRNWAAGDGLVYNAGEAPVEGYTAFLWVMVAAPAVFLGFEPLTLWQVLSLLLQVGTVGALYLLGRERDGPVGRALLAPGLLCVHVSFVLYPMTGMETSFVTCLVSVVVLMLSRDWHTGVRGALALGSALLVLALVRFDALGIVGLVMLWVLVVERRVREVAWASVPLAIGLAAFNLWRLAYYGALLPNTFYAKTGDLGQQLRGGLAYTTEFALYGGPFWLLLLIPLLARVWTERFPIRRPMHRAVPVSTWLVVGQVGYVIVVGGDWMPHFRFFLPVLPLLCFLLQESFWWGIDRLEAGGLPSGLLGAVRWSGVTILLLVAATPLAASRYVFPPPPGLYWSAPDARSIGRSLNDRLPPDAQVAIEWAGIIPYYLDRPVLDIFGLSETDITHGEFEGSRMGRAITPEFLAEREPDLVIYVARLFDSYEAAAAVGPEVRGEGLWITGFLRRLLEPQYGYERCVMDLGESAFWPTLVRSDWVAADRLCLSAER